MKENKKIKIASGVALGLAIAAVAGYYYGSKKKNEKNKKTETKK